MSQETEPFDQLPDAIVARLKARDQGLALLTPAVDRAVETAAREQFAPRRSRTAAAHGWRYTAAAAAAVALIAVFIAQPFAPDEAELRRLADDVDGSGRVDVLDALALARSRAADPAAVSQSRIDALLAGIVSLDAGEGRL
jgi:hypothetical protein